MRALLLLGLLIATPAAARDRQVPVTEFDRIVVEGPYRVRLVTGGSPRAVVSGSDAAVEAVTVDQQGQTLRIRRNPNAWSSRPGQATGPVTIALSTRAIRSARIVGAGEIEVSGRVAGLRVDLAIEGSGRIAARQIDADALSIGLRGSGGFDLAGTTESLHLDVQGSGSVAGAELSAQNATLLAATSGEVRLAARTQAVVTANGLGSVVISGRPACTVRGPRAAQVRCGENAPLR
jgi:hypothetical protein